MMNRRRLSRVVRQSLLHRYVVTLKAREGEFAGVLVDADRDVFVFEQCTTVPSNIKEGTPADIPGRVIVDRASVAYLQEWWYRGNDSQ